NPAVDVLQVGRLPGPPRSVVDDLAGDLTRREVDQRHEILTSEESPQARVEFPLEIHSQHFLGGRLYRSSGRELFNHLLEEDLYQAQIGFGAEDHERDPAPSRSVEP